MSDEQQPPITTPDASSAETDQEMAQVIEQFAETSGQSVEAAKLILKHTRLDYERQAREAEERAKRPPQAWTDDEYEPSPTTQEKILGAVQELRAWASALESGLGNVGRALRWVQVWLFVLVVIEILRLLL